MSNRKTWVKLNGAGGSVLLSRRKVVCVNASSLGFCKIEARAGDIIAYGWRLATIADVLPIERNLARVLGVIDEVRPASDYPGIRKGDLLVLQLSYDGTFAYLRVVRPEDVNTIHSADRLSLLAWFARPDITNDPASIGKYAAYGSLSASYIADHCQDGKLIPWQDGIGQAPMHRADRS